MGRRSIAAVMIVAAVVAAFAVAEYATATKVIFGNIEVVFDGGFSPNKLPKNKLTPITFKASGKIRTLDGKHLPALKEVVLDTDKNGAIDAKGVPVCPGGKLQATTTANALKACKPALVGEGTTVAEVEFPEQKPIDVTSKLLAFNGGVKGGTTTIFIHAYFSSPVNGAIVTTVKVSKEHKGRYGTKSVASIPKIAGGFGSVKEFRLAIGRRGYLLAKCPDGHLNAQATAVFAEGTRVSGTVVRPCKPKG
jgi:hypothetical protein